MPFISYTISARRPETHLIDVTLEIRGATSPELDLVMPAWTPGSYKIRDYARHVQDFDAGRHSWRKLDKQRWRVVTGGRDAVIRYRVYAFEFSARGAHLDARHLYFNGAAVFFYVDGAKHVPVTVRFDLPSGWKISTGLPRESEQIHHAADYDELVDAPVEAGTHAVRTFRVRGIPHRLAVYGGGNYDLVRLTADLRRIVQAEAAMFRRLPYRDYTFILHTVAEGYGGLEHRNSTTLQYPPFGFRPRDKYEGFLELAAHEFFHLWNVKRIRPEMLGPFDYEREVHTTLLWAMEGVTSYYDGLFLVRAGLVKPEKYLKKLGARLQAFLDKPGRRHQSLAESSWDAWTKHYQPNEHSPNATVSYYEKGEFAALALDLEIRQRTRNRRSLDDVLRKLLREVSSSGRGFPESRWREAAEEAAGGSLAAFWRDHIEGTAELDLGQFLAHAGLEIRREREKAPNGGDRPASTGWIGALFQKHGDHLSVATVREGSPAERGGLCPRDEVLALDGTRVDFEGWDRRLQDYRVGDRMELTVVRAGFLDRIRIRVGERESQALKIAPVKKPTALQKSIYRAWLRGARTPRV